MDLTAEVGVRFSALQCTLMPGGKNNLVPMSAGLSMAVKLGSDRLGCLEGGREEGSQSGKSRKGENRNPKSKEHLCVLSHPMDCTEAGALLPPCAGSPSLAGGGNSQ